MCCYIDIIFFVPPQFLPVKHMPIMNMRALYVIIPVKIQTQRDLAKNLLYQVCVDNYSMEVVQIDE